MGGGTQSGAIAVLIADGNLPTPDLAFMTDTGRERSGTWPFVNGFIKPLLESVGLELQIVKASYFANIDVVVDGSALIPGFTTKGGGVGKLDPFCSGNWKRDVMERWLRSLGVKTGTSWIGISRDEPTRIRNQHRAWLKLRYPLIFEVPMRRDECVQVIRDKGWTAAIPHSACWMCPNASDSEWLDMKLKFPQDFEFACELEDQVRLEDSHFWLHPSCRPLREVNFTQQFTMFQDRGCTQGCFT